MKQYIAKYAIVLVLLMVVTNLQAQEYKFHSVFIYQFTKYIEWPVDYRSGEFIIAILGESPVTPYLEDVARTKTAGAQKIVVKKVSNINEIPKCNMLFIPRSKSGELNTILAKLTDKPTLVITEKPGLGKQGSGINLITINDKLKFELNEAAIQKSKLKVSNNLLSLAIRI